MNRDYNKHLERQKKKWAEKYEAEQKELQQRLKEVRERQESEEPDVETYGEADEYFIEQDDGALTVEQLLVSHARDPEAYPLNKKIDEVRYNGLPVGRYIRRCLKCTRLIVAYGAFKRRCSTCNHSNESDFEPMY